MLVWQHGIKSREDLELLERDDKLEQFLSTAGIVGANAELILVAIRDMQR